MSTPSQSFLFNETAGGTKSGQTVPIGPTTGAGSVPVVLATDTTFAASTFVDGSDVTQGTKADAAWTGSIGSYSVVSVLKGIFNQLVLLVSGVASSIPAGSSVIGKVGIDATAPGTAPVTVTPTVTAATYAANKVIGGIMAFVGIFPASNFVGVLESITLKFKGSVQTVGFWVAIFDQSPLGTYTDTNTAAINVADTAHLLGIYHLTVPVSVLGTHTIYNLDGLAAAKIGLTATAYVVVVPDATTAALGSTSDMSVTLACL